MLAIAKLWSGKMFFLLMMLVTSLQYQTNGLITQNDDVVTLWYNISMPAATFRFDFCKIVQCEWDKDSDDETHKFVTGVPGAVTYICVTRPDNENCNSWSDAGWNTGDSWGYEPTEAITRVSHTGESLSKRMTIIKVNPRWDCDPETMTWGRSCNPHILNIHEPSLGDEGLYVLGLYVPGQRVQQGTFWIKALPEQEVTKESTTDLPQINPDLGFITLDDTSYEEKIAIETGYTERNEWLNWMRYTAQQNDKTNCIACATARPHLGTIPFRLPEEEDKKGLQCIINLYNASYDPTNDNLCNTLSKLYPSVKIDQVPPSVMAYPGNYTCFQRMTGTRSVGNLTSEFCDHTITIDEDTDGYEAKWFLNHSIARTDLWWMCGDMRLRPRLPANWVGSCTLVQILMPFQIISSDRAQNEEFRTLNIEQLNRVRRSSRGKRDTTPGGSFDQRVYIDSIGVPRGVPDEFKARDQIAAGFESVLFWWVTLNKNVDWINYIYYNQQRFINFTRDAIRGLAEQLGPTSLMTWQNRMALDMLLAEKGGVCKMFGTYCCTFIPNNTAPDGSVTKALEGLTSLSKELAENSGINNPFTDWLESWFGKWSHLVSTLFISVAVVAAILVTCGCCCIPCARGLLQRLIDTTINKTMYVSLKPYNDENHEIYDV